MGETFDPHRMRYPSWVEVAQVLTRHPGPAEREACVVIHVALLLGCAVVIYLACEWFVNAVEWLGLQLDVGPMAVGTILAAVGTALPESVVTLVAVTFGGGPQGKDIGVGAALGGPLVVGTIAYATIGATLIVRRWQARRRQTAPAKASDARDPDGGSAGAPVDPAGTIVGINTGRLTRDQTWFLAIFVVKVGLGLIDFALKRWLGLAFFAAYAVYFWRELRGGGQSSAEDLEPLKLQPRRAVPSKLAVVTQTLTTLALIFLASQVFVGQLQWAGPALGLSPVVVALLLSPLATELPEIMNALIWVRQGKTQLALSNISGAMMIQATVPSGLGLLFTPWRFDTPLLLAGLATIAAVIYLQVLLRTQRLSPGRLTATAVFYSGFALALALTV
ncbi:MAG TPA: sodium:calcium antiporter [Pseudonocardiaceae bacterium]|nr:sodium:calcium antiporter [Pseudonocardiaceae bacterium]